MMVFFELLSQKIACIIDSFTEIDVSFDVSDVSYHFFETFFCASRMSNSLFLRSFVASV